MAITRLPFKLRLSYGVGHVLNDLCASMWFSYLLVYFHYVVRFSNVLAGTLLLVGQVSDALATPFIGLESDRISLLKSYGRRKSWHLLGTICVLLSFGFLFNLCITCSHSADWAQFIYYAPFVIIFQFGWASTQISHLSLIPEITKCENERVELNAIRYAFTVISNVVVYGVTFLLLHVKTGHAENTANITPADAPRFRYLVFIVLGLGAVFSVIFHVGTHEERDTEESESRRFSRSYSRMSWRCWLKEPHFYLVGLLYMCTRLVVNISQVYLPLYVTDSLDLNKSYIAIIPLVVYITGFLTTLVMKPLNKAIGRKWTYAIGISLVLGACVMTFFIRADKLPHLVFATGALLGAGGSTILVTSLSLTADLISENTESGAFVYGAMSFTDKLSNGIAIELIQYFHPCKAVHEACCADCVWYYRGVMTWVPGGVAVAAVGVLLLLATQTIGHRRKHRAGYQALRNPVSENGGATDSLLAPTDDSINADYGTVHRSRSTPPSSSMHPGGDGNLISDSYDSTRAISRSAPHLLEVPNDEDDAGAYPSSPVARFLGKRPHLHPSGGRYETDGVALASSDSEGEGG